MNDETVSPDEAAGNMPGTCPGLPADDLDDAAAHNAWIDEREAADDAEFITCTN